MLSYFTEAIARRKPVARDAIGEAVAARRRAAARMETATVSRMALTTRDPAPLVGSERVAVPRAVDPPAELMAHVSADVLALLGSHFAHQFRALPFKNDGAEIDVAVAEAPSRSAARELHFLVATRWSQPFRLRFVVIDERILARLLDTYYPPESFQPLLATRSEIDRAFSRGGSECADPRLLRAGRLAGNATERVFEGLLLKAILSGASEVRIEALERHVRVRMRRDGHCEPVCSPLPPRAAEALAEVALRYASREGASDEPQRGHFRLRAESSAGRTHDVVVEVTVARSVFGDATTLRLRDARSRALRLDELGADPATLVGLREARESERGLVVICGPGRSGRSTTLGAFLQSLDRDRLVVESLGGSSPQAIEGVAHYGIQDCRTDAMRRLVRRVLDGEGDVLAFDDACGDEGIQLLVEAALSGRRVATTMIAPSATRAIGTLAACGPSDVASILTLVVNQRLLRRLCALCSVDVAYSRGELLEAQFAPAALGAVAAREPVGCAACGWTGYTGSVPVFETILVRDGVREATGAGALETTLAQAAVRAGMRPLRLAALERVARGEVALANALKATERVPAWLLAEAWATSREHENQEAGRSERAGVASAHPSAVARRLGAGGPSLRGRA